MSDFVSDDLTVHDLFASGKRWVYWLDIMQPDSDNPHIGGAATLPFPVNLYRVCVVFEGVDGYYPTGNPDRLQSPWYWDQATCDHQNKQRGFSKEAAALIVASSIGARPRWQKKL